MVRRTEDNPYEIIWLTQTRQTRIHYIEDFLVDARYFLVEGRELEDASQKIRSSVSTYTDEDIRRIAKNAKERAEQIRAIYYAGIAAPLRFDPEFFRMFEQASSSPDAEVRHALIVAIGYVGWKELHEILEHLRTTDLEESVREDAGIMLEALGRE